MFIFICSKNIKLDGFTWEIDVCNWKWCRIWIATHRSSVEVRRIHLCLFLGERTLLTPERCIQLQGKHINKSREILQKYEFYLIILDLENIGSDIAMQLDHVIPSLTQGPLVEEASLRSIRLFYLVVSWNLIDKIGLMMQ